MYTNLPVNVIVRLPHPRSRDSQGQEGILGPSSEKQSHCTVGIVIVLKCLRLIIVYLLFKLTF